MHAIEQTGYQHAKEACYLCMKNEDLVDTDIPIEGEGVLAICRNCVLEMAMALDLAIDQAVANEIRDLTAENGRIKDSNDRMQRQLKGVRAAVRG